MVESWLKSTTQILQQLECTPRDSIICTVSQLQWEAYTWWKIVTTQVLAEVADWEFFQKKYVGELYLEDRKQEFLMLKLKDMLIVDYEWEYWRLSKYTKELIPTEEEN
ncbi:Hexaprenyldihydroxybenzoate methyltransferase, mitochondrial-like protein [Gossypium australe]|uniref:Hexaprenyldihydroxybenzoate methyltransferase, mitochondrial-like protein n=1 Tax=Gossypium australe TaxID=47621 RepID=A0A5B6VAA7_9ROSI|nr:Hexaprenyldihydroxybenzoate methyltransferase, mitochondrial-like protein [Gossypium australe]